MSQLVDRHVDQSQVALARVIIRQALNAPRLRDLNPLAVAIALTDVAGDLEKSAAAMGTDVFATMSNL